MKKLLLAAMAASMLLTFTACGNSDKDDDDDEKESKASVSSTADDDKDDDSKNAAVAISEPDESTAEESKAEEPEAEESEAEESKAEESEAEVVSGDVFTGTGYTLNIDGNLWKDSSDMNSAVDCAFMYVGDSDNLMSATANFNVITQSMGAMGDLSPKDYAETVKAQYDGMDGYTLKNDSAVTVNGMDAYKIEVSVEQSGLVMDMAQVIMVEDGNLFCISYGAEESVYPSLEKEFEKVVSSFKIV